MMNDKQRATNYELRATSDERRVTDEKIHHSPFAIRHFPYLILVLAMGLAIFLRFYKLGEVPPALNGDEAVFGSGALQILQEGPVLSVEGQGGAGVLASYIAAFFFALSEPGKMALRFQTSFFGVLTVLLLFLATRALFLNVGRVANLSYKDLPVLNMEQTQANWLGAIAALLLAVSYSHATISRISFAIVHLPFLELLSVWLFWTAYRSGKRWHFILAGASLALAMYGYVAGFVMPGLFFGFVLVNWAIETRRQGDKERGRQGEGGTRTRSGFFTRQGEVPNYDTSASLNTGLRITSEKTASVFHSSFFILHYSLPFAFGIIPLLFTLFGSGDVETAGRMGQTSFLNPVINQGDPLGALWRGVWGNLGAFGLAPLDWALRGNWRQLWMQPFYLAVFGGILFSLWRFKRAPYQFLLLWWGLTLVPAALAPSEIPSPSRAIGVFAPMMIFAALAVVELLRLAVRSIAGQRANFLSPRLPSTVYRLSLLAGVIIPLALLAWLTISIFTTSRQQFDHYFNVWPYTNDALAAFDDYADDLARDMASLATPQSVFLLPRNTSAGSVSPNGSVNFFYRLTNSPAPHLWVPDDEASLPTALTKAAEQASTFNVARWKVSKHTGADPKEVFRYYLEKYGALTQFRTFQDYNIETYTMSQVGQDFQAAETLPESDINFGGQLALTGYAYGNAGPGDPQTNDARVGDPVWARLRWKKLADHPEDLKVSLILKDASGHRVVSVDKHLQNNLLHQRSSQWELESVEDTYFILDLPPDAMPGEYALSALLYGEESQSPLFIIPGGEREFSLGTLHLLPPGQVPASPALPAGTPAETPDGDLELYADSIIIPDNLRPGDRITLEAVWRAPVSPRADYAFQLDLRSEAGEVIILLPANPIGGEAYPTHRWRAGETLRQHYSAAIPPGTSGDFVLTASILGEGSAPTRREIGSVAARDWEHTFDLPADATPLKASFRNGDILLVGYNLDWKPADASASGLVSVTLYWQADAPSDKNYTAFNHILNEAGELVAQLDRPPTGGAKPMTGWLPGEIISDTFTLALPAGAAPESLLVTVGLYDPDTFQRLPVSLEGKNDDKVVLR